jgi:hypothetical protein
MPSHKSPESEFAADWFGRDHVLVVQAAANYADAPAYARQLWETAEDPVAAAMQLVAVLVGQRAGEFSS